MPVGSLVALLLVAMVANLVLMAVVVAPTLRGRPSPFVGPEAEREPVAAPDQLARTLLPDGTLGRASTGALDGVPTATYDRVVRIVSFVFILSTSVIVAVTGLWSDTEPAVLALLAIAGLFVLAIHDIVPGSVLGPARFVAEGSVAITLITLLVALTGRETSPFFFAFPLIVVGSALVIDARSAVALTTAATIGYLAAVGIRPAGDALSQTAIATVGVDCAAIVLLSYVAIVIAREQRRSRLAAVRMSTVDSLTGLYNRTFFYAALEREVQRSARSDRGFCLLMMDLDGLKATNDQYGHFAGDRALSLVGETIRANVRRIDTAARYGGDEFVAVLPETDPTGAYVVAEKIRRNVVARLVAGPGFEIRTSLSIGVVLYPDDGRTVDDLMIAADRAMYRSKSLGKNRVVGSDVPIDVPGEDAADSGGIAPHTTGAAESDAGRTAEPVGVMAETGDGMIGDPM